MGRRRKNGMSAEKLNVIGQIIQMYDVKTTADLQDTLKDLPGGTIQSMLEAEMDEQIDEREEADLTYTDSRNGYKPETLRSGMGEIPIQVPRDRNSDFEPQVVPKYKKDIIPGNLSSPGLRWLCWRATGRETTSGSGNHLCTVVTVPAFTENFVHNRNFLLHPSKLPLAGHS